MDIEVRASELDDKKADMLILDVRGEIAYRHGHLPGAVLQSGEISVVEMNDLLQEYGKRKVLFYCNVGEKSMELAGEMRNAGIEAYSLKGGFRAWLLEAPELLSAEEAERYSRQILLPEIGKSGQEKLKNAKVLVIGAGALGSAALTYLALAGVGTIGIADGDRLELSNMHRQILYKTDSIGGNKALLAKKRLEVMNPDVRIIMHDYFVTPDNIMECIQDYDFIVDGTDRIETKFLINDACVLLRKAFCHAGILRFEGQVMTWTRPEHACYRCVFEDVPEEYIPNCSEAGIVGAVAGVIGSVQALEAIKYITGTGELLVGKIFTFDALTMKSRIVPVSEKNKACKVCGKQPSIVDVRQAEELYRLRGCGNE